MNPRVVERHFQIGVVRASLRTTLRGVRNLYSSLYRSYRVAEPQGGEIRVEVRRGPRSLRYRPRYQVSVNGRPHGQPVLYEEVLPNIEWAFAWEIPEVMPEYLQLHSSAMEVEGKGVVFPGESGSGKSTLTAGLLTRGWRYLCDEFALLHAETLRLHPYPRAICLKKPSHPVIRSLGLRLHGNRNHLKMSKGWVGFVDPLSVRPDAVGSTCPIRYVVFPKYTAGAQPALVPISRAEAAFVLHQVCYNLSTCRRLGTDVLAGMIRGASCYRLISGEINATCDLLVHRLRSEEGQQARSA